MLRRQKHTLQRKELQDAIAIVGIGCRFPGGVTGPAAYWELLKNGVDAITEVPADRWSNLHFFHPDREQPGKIVTRYGGFVDRIAQFDPQFFGISPHEAEEMDPQQRLLLEVAWEALEDGAQLPRQLAGRDVGVFMGAFSFDYHALQFSDPFQRQATSYSALSSMATMIANRLSYTFDFRGPSVTLDTACSSSLFAVHMAAESLRRGESWMALAGGVTLLFTPQYSIIESKGGFLSPDGRCKTFDAAANGYVRGEGVGIVVLKRLQDALADGDPIQGVILASGANQDGHTVGITVPNSQAQEALIRQTLGKAGISPLRVRYVEAHGTGTAVGDPLEAQALGRVYGKERSDGCPLFIGSCKTNIGHTEAAAGIAGLIKTVLCLKHRQIPPNLHFHTPNPQIPFAEWRLRVPTRLEPWPDDQGSAVAAVNSFGYGGTNVHIILQEAPYSGPAAGRGKEEWVKPYLLPLSARSAKALAASEEAYGQALEKGDASAGFLLAFCRSAALRREHHPYRKAFVFPDQPALLDLLERDAVPQELPGVFTGKKAAGPAPKLVWIFSGMGPQWWGMGRQLMEREPVFRAMLERCDRLYREIAGWSILQEMGKPEGETRIHQTYIAMTVNFAVQAALAELWRHWGIVPAAIVGHSAGEVAAFYAAGIYPLEDALQIVFHRSRLLHRLSGRGRMAAVGLPEAVVLGVLQEGDKVEIAAVNSPMSVTLTGDTEALLEIAGLMREKKYFCRELNGDVPYHSRYMEEIRAELWESIAPIQAKEATCPLYSSVTGERLHREEIHAEYWWHNVRDKVQFARVIRTLMEEGFSEFLEIGPHPVLTGAVTECLMDKRGHVVSSLNRKKDESAAMLESLAQLYTHGFEPDWAALYPEGGWVSLPTYPWQQETYWREEETCRQIRLGYQEHPFLGRPHPGPIHIWEGEISLTRFPFIGDHRVLERVVFPAAGYIEAIAAALHAKWGMGSFAIEEFEVCKGIHVTETQVVVTQYCLDPEYGTVKMYAKEEGTGRDFSLYAKGYVRLIQNAPFGGKTDLAGIRRHCPVEVERERVYRLLQRMGFDYGVSFQGVQKVFLGRDEALAEVWSAFGAEPSEFWFHPVLMDACFQALLAIDFPSQGEGVPEEVEEFRIPVRIGQIRIYQKPADRLWAHGKLTYKDDQITRGDLAVYNTDGCLVAEFLDFVKEAVDAGSGRLDQSRLGEWLFEVDWRKEGNTGTVKTEVVNAETVSAEAANTDESADGVWLIFADRQGVASGIGNRVKAMGGECMLVFPGDTYAFSPPENVCRVVPTDPEEYRRLLRDLQAAKTPGQWKVVHCWNLDLPSAADMAEPHGAKGEWEEIKTLGSHSLLFLLQSLTGMEQEAKIWLVTRGAQCVGKEPGPAGLFQSAAWGLGRVIGQQEWQQYWGGAIDLDSTAAPEEAAALLLREMLGEGRENQVAFRGGDRYLPRLKKAAGLAGSLPARLRADGTYLITGAFGALGRDVARLLVKRGARWLILLSRSALPERHRWESAGFTAEIRSRIGFIRELESQGTHILTVPVNLSDAEAMAAFCRDFASMGWPALRGVIHSAGVLRDLLLEQMDRASFDEVYDPKAKGAWVLHRTFRHEPLEFFILFSSAASLLPAAGQGNYAAANAFLDALAAHRRAQGLPALSINWGPWVTGMVKEQNLVEHYRSLGMECITPGLGMQILEHLMAQDTAQILAVSADWGMLSGQYPQEPPFLSLLCEETKQKKEQHDAKDQWLDRLKELDPAARERLIKEKTLQLVSEILHYEPSVLQQEKSLPEIGLDSMTALKLRSRLLHELGVVFMVSELLSGISIEVHAGNAVQQLERLLVT